MNHTLSDSQLEEMIKSAVNSSGPLPPDEKFSQLVSALRELQERRKADSEPVAWTDEEELRDVNVAGIGYLFGIDREANKFADPRRQIMLYRHAQPEQELKPVRNPVLAYADSYRDMAKQGIESVPIWSVITDLERNIAPLYRHAQPAPDTEREPIAWLNDAYLARGVVDGEAGSEDAGPGYIPVYREASPVQPAPVVLTFEEWCKRSGQKPQGWVRDAMKEAYEGGARSAPERDKVRREHAEWSQTTFGNVGPIGPLKHLSKEALEAAAEPGDLSEWADMQFLLWDAQRRAGITDEQITQAMIEKLAVNKQREWPAPKDGEPQLHIKELPAPVVPDEAQSRAIFEKWCSVNIERNKWHPEFYAHLPAREQWAAWEACRAAMLQAGNSPAIPDGYVMVPKEPTKEMIDAGWLHFMGTKNPSSKGTYKAMLEAAPQEVKGE